MIGDLCPHCGQQLPSSGGYLTARELDVLTAWWMTDSVKGAAQMVGVGEQRAKNLLSRARIRNAVSSNGELLALHFGAVRTKATKVMQQNMRRVAV